MYRPRTFLTDTIMDTYSNAIHDYAFALVRVNISGLFPPAKSEKFAL